jgi:NAD(P)-dependent dehydrogenase (short-subunit alcohol dehydrogenase family)
MSRSAGRLEGKIAIVSGGATGAGGAASLLFAQEGAQVAVVDINTDAGEEVVTRIRTAGGTAELFAADVSKREAVDAAVANVMARFGRIDVP